MIYLISIQKIIILILSKLPHKQDAFFFYLSQCGGYNTTVIKCPKTYVFSTYELNLFFFRKFMVLCFTIILCLTIIKDIPINAFLIRTKVHKRIKFPISPNSLYCKC